MNIVTLEYNGKSCRADMSLAIDLSIAFTFDESQLKTFEGPPAYAAPLITENFIGDVNRGGSCNCSTYHLTPHCNGTHTECAGHITREKLTINRIAPTALLLATLVSVKPEKTATTFSESDAIITRELLQQQLNRHQQGNAVIVRTLPNVNKLNANYESYQPAYFDEQALAWLASIGIDHLLVDLPSVDRMQDSGLLLAHRAFWGLPHGSVTLSQATRIHATITELIYVPDTVPDGNYLLNLQIAPLEADASPSRPLLYPLTDINS